MRILVTGGAACLDGGARRVVQVSTDEVYGTIEVPVADRPGHDRRYSMDDSLLRGMGYRLRISFAARLAATVRWYRDNRPWWEPLKRITGERSSPAAEAAGGPSG